MVSVVKTLHPSFPNVTKDKRLKIKKSVRWQVLCGDRGHYRIGIYSPEHIKKSDIKILEKHSCPEFFMLIKGELSLLLIDDKGREKVLKLLPYRPIFVSTWHNGFSPAGKFKGVAIVVERDEFDTEYRRKEELTKRRRR